MIKSLFSCFVTTFNELRAVRITVIILCSFVASLILTVTSAIGQKTPNVENRLEIDSCVACHGSNTFIDAKNPADLWKSSYQIWRIRDPHTRAYSSLWNARSKKIVTALLNEPVNELRPKGASQIQKDHESIINERCVSCHSTAAGNKSLWAGGVSCHSCHSNVSLGDQPELPWIEQHTTQDWADGKLNKPESGLFDLTNLNSRAQACIRCHVGSENRDVNHDLIAAGHPRLMFEYSSHLSRLPKHWIEKSQSKKFNAECWSIGQFEVAKSSLQLLQTRVRLADENKGPWPEFSEYNCHNCHHDLTGIWYVPNSGLASKPAWATWAFVDGNYRGSNFPDISELREEMQKTFPDKKAVDSLAGQLIKAAGNHSSEQHLFDFIHKEPQLNSDELFAWYLAAASVLRDISNDSAKIEADRGFKSSVLKLSKLMTSLKSFLDLPFKYKENRQKEPPEKINGVVNEIRVLLVPILRTQNESSIQNQ